MWPPAVIDHIFEYHCTHVVELKSAVACFAPVHRTWNATAARLTCDMFFNLPYELDPVCSMLQFWPSPARWARIVLSAVEDWNLMHVGEYTKLVQAQLLLQHLRVNSRRVTLEHVLDLFVGVVDVRLSAMHPFILRGANLTVGSLAVDVGDAIPWLQWQWRQAVVDHFCLGTFLNILRQTVAQRDILMHMQGLHALWRPDVPSTPGAPAEFCSTFRTSHRCP
jgi:hypothetical protein